MKKIILSLTIVSLFLPLIAHTEPLPGSVGEAIQDDEFFSFPTSTNDETPTESTDEFYQAKILRVTDEIEDPGYGPGTGTDTFTQLLDVEILTGPDKGVTMSSTNQIPLADKSFKKLNPGDHIVIGKTNMGNEIQYYISDIYRLNSLWIVLVIFIGITLLLTKFQGLKAFAGLFASFVVITWYILPQILHGGNPTLVSIIGTTIIAATSLYIAHGFHRRTSIAFVGTLISIALAVTLSYIFVRVTHLFGMGSEEAFYLQFAPGTSINLRGLLLGGIIIGVLGILDDITTAQAAVVEQIYHANPTLSSGQLYKRGSVVGREHILSLVNTLVLAYTGASLPLILLFKIYQRPIWVTLNSEIIMEEIVRMLIGSITLIIAVPITTFIAAEYYNRRKPSIPEDLGESHGHVH